MADVGTGAVLTLGTSSWTAELTAINGSGISRESFQTSHLGTSTWHTHIPGDLTEPGSLELEFHFDPSNPVPITAAAEAFTITFDDKTTTSDSEVSGNGFFVAHDYTTPLEDLMAGSATIKLSGSLTWGTAS